MPNTPTAIARPTEWVVASILGRNLVAAEIEDVILYGNNDNEVHPDWLPAVEAVRDSGAVLRVATKIANVAAHAILCVAHETGEDPRAVLHRLSKRDCEA